MSKFHVESTYQIAHKNLLVFIGDVVEGVIKEGMFIHAFPNTTAKSLHRIIQVESASNANGRKVCLCVRTAEKEDLDRLMKIRAETLEVSA